MSNPLMGGAMAFAFALVGALSVTYASTVAYDGADQESDVLEVFQPLAEVGLTSIAVSTLIIAAVTIVAATGWLLSYANRGNSSVMGGRR